LIFTLLFLVFALVSLLRAVLRAEKVTHDTIYRAISVYLMLAIVWGAAYMLLQTVQPGAFSMDTARHGNRGMNWFDCVFYSFVTLITIGYGDIVPITAQARWLSVLEAISGTLYVAVLIARLVGQGYKIALSTLDGGRIGVGAQATGIAQGAFEAGLAYSKQRMAFGHPISHFRRFNSCWRI
jgi:Ion channel/Acyl-CoA dehydrogenase, C-terminal domain